MVTVSLSVNWLWMAVFAAVLFVLIKPRLARYVAISVGLFVWRFTFGMALMVRAIWPRW